MAVRYLGRRDHDRMRQPLGVDGEVALDAGDLFARAIALPAGVSVFFTPCASTIKNWSSSSDPVWRGAHQLIFLGPFQSSRAVRTRL